LLFEFQKIVVTYVISLPLENARSKAYDVVTLDLNLCKRIVL